MNSTADPLHLAWCSADAARYACEHWHYSGAVPATHDMKVGVWEAGQFIGIVLFSRGSNRFIGAPYGLPMTEVCELTRVALRQHKASVSRIVAIALRMLKREAPGLRLVVSYADPGQGHVGGIYQAGNWLYVGRTEDSSAFFVNGVRIHHRKSGQDGWKPPAGTRIVVLPGKHKYLMPLDPAMRVQLLPLVKPFPKAADHVRAKQR